MNVYFIPLGGGRFEPYFEQEDEEAEVGGAEGGGFFARMRHRFSDLLREAERHRHERAHDEPAGVTGRLKRSLFRWIAERVAEQRLLWRLRSVDAAVLLVPDDLPAAEAERLLRQVLQRDADRHLRLLAVHTLGLAASAPFALIPGPNIFGYFFTFTVVGHFLSFRGARRATRAVRWTVEPNATLTELGRALGTSAPERHRLIHDVADRLRLPRLALFVERMAVPTA